MNSTLGKGGVAAGGQRDFPRRERLAVLDRGEEAHDGEHEHRHDAGNDEEGCAPADSGAERRARGHAEHEGDGAAAARHGHRARNLVLRHQIPRVGSRDSPEESVRETAEHTRDHEQAVVGGKSRPHVRDREDDEHDEDEVLAVEAPRERREGCGREHDGAREDRHEQAHLGFGDVEVTRDLR